MHILFFLFILLSTSTSLISEEIIGSSLQKKMDEAYQAYQSGEQAKTLLERNAEFNKALSLYSEIEPHVNDGRLLYNIGNSYYQLGEYPWAILYYYRAKRWLPRDLKIKHNLEMAKSKLNIPLTQEIAAFNILLAFHRKLSEQERLQVFFYFSLGLIIVSSIFIWFPIPLLKLVICSLAACSLLLFSSLMVTRYFSSIEAVIVGASPLYRDAGVQYAHVTGTVLIPGSKTSVLEVLDSGHWLKIMTPEGTIGYIQEKYIRII